MIIDLNLSTIKKCILLISLSIFLLSGCASFGKGVAEAVMEKADTEDTRGCQVRGNSFEGIAPGSPDHATQREPGHPLAQAG